MTHPMGGFISTPDIGNRIAPGVVWAADNGRFNSPEHYSDERYLRWLSRQPKDQALFATAPDVVADHAATVEMSRPMLPRIRDAGYPAAFCAQDGATVDAIPWEEFDALFIGGSTDWKLSQAAAELIAEGKRRGKWCHVGRVNSYRRLRLAAVLGADSVDGTFLRFGPDVNIPRLLGWLEELNAQPHLGLECA